MPEPCGKEVELCLFIDSDHANDRIRRRSQTGFCIFINMACITWFTKQQLTIKSAVFGLEFVVLKQAVEASCGFWF